MCSRMRTLNSNNRVMKVMFNGFSGLFFCQFSSYQSHGRMNSYAWCFSSFFFFFLLFKFISPGIKQIQLVNARNLELYNKLESQRNEFEHKIKESEKKVAQIALDRKNLLLEKQKVSYPFWFWFWFWFWALQSITRKLLIMISYIFFSF